MIKGLALVLGIHLLATASVQAQTTEDKGQGLTGSQIVGGLAGAATLSSGTLARMNFQQMFAVYQKASVKSFVSISPDGDRLSTGDIRNISRDVRPGDEVRITFKTSEGEERRARIALLSSRKEEVNRELIRLRIALTGQSGDTVRLSSVAQQLGDNQYILAELDKELQGLHSGETRLNVRTATRVVDMSRFETKELEAFLYNKSRVGKHVIQVERIPRAARMEVAQMQRLMRGQIIVALIGGAVLLEEVAVGILGDGMDELLDSKVYVPALVEGQEN